MTVYYLAVRFKIVVHFTRNRIENWADRHGALMRTRLLLTMLALAEAVLRNQKLLLESHRRKEASKTEEEE